MVFVYKHCDWMADGGQTSTHLPDVPSRERGATYYCMLFNDEVHTYEQVIYTLQKAVNCTQKEAVSFATTVDRDVSERPPGAVWLGVRFTPQLPAS